MAPPSTTLDSPPVADPELPLLRDLVRALGGAGIRCCHWKSNFHVGLALAGVDVLVERRRFEEFVSARNGALPGGTGRRWRRDQRTRRRTGSRASA